ncbi:MAG: hypothetical protein RQ867_00075 [Mariprofundaceae bacterium]|nr:hypothetical protein [Mariprofundaceae bacterium]
MNRFSAVIFIIVGFLVLAGCARKPTALADITLIKEGQSIIAYRTINRQIRLEYDGKATKLISIEELERGPSIYQLGWIGSDHPNKLRAEFYSDENLSISSVLVGGQQELRFDTVKFDIAPGKVNYIGDVVFDTVIVRRRYPGQSRLIFYFRISIPDRYAEIIPLLKKEYPSAEIINASKDIALMLFNDENRFYQRRNHGWVEKVDKVIP